MTTATWISKRVDKSHYHYLCSRCGATSRYQKSIYCHNCGARMTDNSRKEVRR